MKYLIIVFFLSVSLSKFKAQNPSFQWAKTISGPSNEIGKSIYTDASGNVYTIGQFAGTVDFDPGVGVFNLTSVSSYYDIFLSKLDQNGNFLWAKTIGGSLTEDAIDLHVDALSNIYITGTFKGTVDFDPSGGVSNLSSISGFVDVFICKFDGNGNFVWAKNIGGSADVGVNDICVDGLGNVYTTGYFEGNIDFNPSASSSFTISSSGYYDIFINKLDNSGDFVWTKSIGAAVNYDFATSMDLDASGNVFITGQFSGTVDFDPGIAVYNLTTTSGTFFLKLDQNGIFSWAKQINGTALVRANSIDVDSNGNIYATGFLNGTIDFDPNVGTYSLSSTGSSDIFILKLDLSGNFIWAKVIGDVNSDAGSRIIVDANSDVFVAGSYQGSVSFDSFNLTPLVTSDEFIIKLNPLGNILWAKSFGGASSDLVNSIFIDSSNNLYITGYYASTVEFDLNTSSFTMNAIGQIDAFVLKMSQCNAPNVPVNITPSINLNICENNSAVLQVSGAGTINWYASPSSTLSLGAGNSYTTALLNSGIYTYYAEASTCTLSASRASITVTVTPLPNVSINASSMTICQGSSVTLNGLNAINYSWANGINDGVAFVPSATAIYSVTGIDVNSCSNTATISITVNTPPTIVSTTSDLFICTGETSTLTAIGASTYTWSNGLSNSVILVSPIVTTTYTVIGTDINGCQNSDTITQSVSLCTAINEFDNLEKSFIIYPNPSNGEFTIIYNKGGTYNVTNAIGASCKNY
jgi:hypothetical protein